MSGPSTTRSVWFALTVLVLVSGCREVTQPALEASGNQGLFPIQQNDRWGYITRQGSVAIAPQFDRAYRFSGSRALIRQKDGYGYIDRSGEVIISPQYGAAWHFSDGLAPVRTDSRWGFIDPDGATVIQPRFFLSKEALPASLEEAGQGTVGRRGGGPTVKVLVPPDFADAQYFVEDRARFRRGGDWGFIDRTGAVSIEPRFTRAWDFHSGLARVRTEEGRLGYVTQVGHQIWPATR